MLNEATQTIIASINEGIVNTWEIMKINLQDGPKSSTHGKCINTRQIIINVPTEILIRISRNVWSPPFADSQARFLFKPSNFSSRGSTIDWQPSRMFSTEFESSVSLWRTTRPAQIHRIALSLLATISKLSFAWRTNDIISWQHCSN